MKSATASGERHLVAPAKINLTLDVFAPRLDGFHDLDSVVALVLPGDEVTVRRHAADCPGRAVCLTVAGADSAHVPNDARNLAHQAAHLFLERFVPQTEKVGVAVHLNKRLPAQAGLGGGSSDAAAVLRALSDLFPGAATPADLAAAGASLGSDVPLFLSGAPLVRLRGRGEIVEPLTAAFSLFGVLVRPDAGVPTGPAYALLDALPGRVPGKATGALVSLLATGNAAPEDLGAALGNDFEAAVLPAFPNVACAHRQVQEVGALRALLCGSGSAVFGLARDEDHAQELARRLRATGGFPWVEAARLAVETPDA
jgi:4-diphosphocytidyl-2-C-methyl-D-erythritol kinase